MRCVIHCEILRNMYFIQSSFVLGHHPGDFLFGFPFRSSHLALNVEVHEAQLPRGPRPRLKAGSLRALGVASCDKSVHRLTLKELSCKVLTSLFFAHVNHHTSVVPYLAPWVLQNLVDIVSLLDVAIQHAADEVDTIVANCVRHT